MSYPVLGQVLFLIFEQKHTLSLERLTKTVLMRVITYVSYAEDEKLSLLPHLIWSTAS